MGSALSSTRRPLIMGRARQDHRILILRHGDPKDSILLENWKANDVLYQHIKSERKMQMSNDPGSIMLMMAIYSPCENSRCKCKAGKFTENECYTVGWANSKCNRSGCNHPLSDHIRHIEYLSNTEYVAVIKLVYDINNIKASLEISYAYPKFQRNIMIESVYESVYKVLCKSVRYDPFKAPNIDTIYGSPPFEQISIRQILINFSMLYFSSNKEVLTFKQAFMATKFLLQSFDLWMWTAPDKILYFYPELFSNSYSYYFCRYIVFCETPRITHSISLRYKATEIFGCDVLKYTLKFFYKHLQVRCYKSNIMWNEHTNLYSLNYMSIYMDLLKKEVYNRNSPIFTLEYHMSDVMRLYELYQYP